MIKINFQEWKFIGFIWLALILLTFSPIIFGWLITPPDKFFLGRPPLNGGDVPVYYSYIEEVKEGNFLFKNLFTSESHLRFIFDPFWLGVGFLAKVFHFSSIFAYHLSRFLLLPIFLLVAYYLVAFFFQEEIKRKICFIFLIFASGLGGFWGGSNLAKPMTIPIDLWVPEAFSFLTIYISPHFIASLILIILIFLLSLLALENYKLIYSLGAGLSALFLFQFHPYHLPTIFGVLGVFFLFSSLRERSFNFNFLKHCLILFLFSLPPIFYHYWVLKNIWVRQQHFLQNITLTPSLPIIFISYGFLIILALVGVFSIFKNKEKEKKEIFLLSWFFTQFLLIYSPFSFQRRLTEGLQIAMAILATFALFYLKNWLKGKMNPQRYFLGEKIFSSKVFLIYIFFILFFSSGLAILLSDLTSYIKKHPYMYLEKEEAEAMFWLRQNTPPSSVIISSYEKGDLIPAFSLRQVYLGHGHQTAKFEEKWEKTKRFFESADSDKEKILFLRANKIDYLFFSEEEKNQAKFNPDEKSFLERAYSNSRVVIYKVK